MPAPDKEGEYEIEKILGHRRRKDGKRVYLVKWKGYTYEESTWEEVRTVYKTKDRPSFKIRVLLLLALALHAVRLSPVALHTHDTTLVMSSVMEQSFCVKSVVRV